MGDGTRISKDVVSDVAWVRERVDPEHTLPKVELPVSPDNLYMRGTLVFTKYDVVHEGRTIGEVTINTDLVNHACWTNKVHIDEEFRGQGFGLSTYVSAIEKSLSEGYTFRTHDWSQTTEAKHVWDILVEKGVATVVEPFVPDGRGRFNGHCEVKPRM